MNRMIFEFSRIETLEGVTRTPYNQYESVILPIQKWLESHGVDFSIRATVTDIDFKDGEKNHGGRNPSGQERGKKKSSR